MRNCPKCEDPIANDAICCNHCGWTSPNAKSKDADDVDSAGRERRCAYHDAMGVRCHKRASTFTGHARVGRCTEHNNIEGKQWQRAPIPEHVRSQIDRLTRRWNVTPEAKPDPRTIHLDREDWREEQAERAAIQAEGRPW